MKKQKIAFSDKQAILKFFLNLYKIQSGTDMGEYLSTTIDNFDPTSSYNLRVQKFTEWKSRRISISSIGDGSGSKSKCFKVIYDDILVVKIPPSPIPDFSTYLECIDMERRIADRLKPDIECIVPGVSTILKRIPPFSRDADQSPSEFEKKCVERMKVHPRFQDYLKIGGRFAFFMSLSKHSFLSNIIRTIHDEKEVFVKEILGQTDLIVNPVMFGEKYGVDNEPLFYKINEVYLFYVKEIGRLTNRQEKAPAIPAYKAKEWFLFFLAGKEVKADLNPQFPSWFLEKTRLLLKAIVLKFGNEIVAYRRMIGEYVLQKMATRNQTVIEGLIANLLKLIGDLKDKRVAIRDLKPDNVFVVGDWESNPLLLSSPENYSIGLIDFETSVCCDTGDDAKIAQPLLAGTPSYATPSHLFKNDLLTEIHEDLPRILFFQDWQAVMNMIYNVATGKHLAQKTGMVLPVTMRSMQTSLTSGQPMPDVYIKSSRMFWQRAAGEFGDKLKENGQVLKSMKAAVPENTRETLRQEIIWDNEKIRTTIVKLTHSQEIFKSRNARLNLMKSAPETITRYKNKWINGIDVPKAPPRIQTEIVGFLEALETLKLRKQYHDRILGMLNREDSRIPVYDLLKVMFHIVRETMYKHEWDTIDETAVGDGSAQEISHEATIAYERTIVCGGVSS